MEKRVKINGVTRLDGESFLRVRVDREDGAGEISVNIDAPIALTTHAVAVASGDESGLQEPTGVIAALVQQHLAAADARAEAARRRAEGVQ